MLTAAISRRTSCVLPSRLPPGGDGAHRIRLGTAGHRVDELENAVAASANRSSTAAGRHLVRQSVDAAVSGVTPLQRRDSAAAGAAAKTLLNVEGLGRQLDPYLDLWATAQPFLEKWMRDQVGPEAIVKRLTEQAPYLSSALPQLPRLIHQALGGRRAAGTGHHPRGHRGPTSGSPSSLSACWPFWARCGYRCCWNESRRGRRMTPLSPRSALGTRLSRLP